MKTKSISISFLLFMGLILFNSCRKDREEYQTTLEEDSYASATFDDVKNMVDEAEESGYVSSYRTSETEDILTTCATVTKDTTTSVKKIIIDFGTSNCTCLDGRNRRGKIISTFTGKYRDAGTVITHTFENYFVDDNEVKGTKTVTNIGNYTYDIKVTGSIILNSNAGTITWNSERQRVWKEGYNTWVLNDDVYEITGSASGTNANGKNYSVTITKPLIRKLKLGCIRNFIEGTLEIEVDGGRTRTLDYGDGTCDNLGTLTIGKRTYTINLR